MNVFPGSSCPMRDLSCMASDGSNVITTTTTTDDAECGGKFIIIINIFLLHELTIMCRFKMANKWIWIQSHALTSNFTYFQSHTFPISHSSNLTLFQSYTLLISHSPNLTLFQCNATLFQFYTLTLLHSHTLILLHSYT